MANNSTGNDGKPSLLLALPIELLQRISEEVSDETLTTFRLTCKAIEAATFDLFAKIFFEERYCYVYYKPRWTLLEDIIRSRMGDSVRRVIFTTNILAPVVSRRLQLAPQDPGEEGDYDIIETQVDVEVKMMEAVGARVQAPAWPSKDAIERCFICIRNLTPNVLVELDFNQSLWCEKTEERTLLKANVIVAMAATRMKLTAFNTSPLGISRINEKVKALGYDLSTRMRCLQSFSLGEAYMSIKAQRLIYGFLESATELRELKLQLYYSVGGRPDLTESTPSRLLSVSNVSRLEVLTLGNLSIEVTDFVAVLSRCKSTLLEVTLKFVCILGSNSVWRQVFDLFVSMPRLSKVHFEWLQHTMDDALANSYFGRLKTIKWSADEGREQLTAELTKLLVALPRVVN
jgi:hypothetical protein